jgi:hypothetical protein
MVNLAAGRMHKRLAKALGGALANLFATLDRRRAL